MLDLNFVLKHELPNGSKIVNTTFQDYREVIQDEIIIKNTLSSGPLHMVSSDIFYKERKDVVTNKGISLQSIEINFKDPSIMLKCIQDAKVVNKNTVISKENKVLVGLQYHYITPALKPNKIIDFDIDYQLLIE